MTFEEMKFQEITFQPVGGYLFAITLSMALLWMVWKAYPHHFFQQLPSRIRTTRGLRLLAAIVLIAGLFRPELVWESSAAPDEQVLILRDVSRSMTTQDLPAARSRLEGALSDSLAIQKAFEKTKSKPSQVRIFDFSDKLSPPTTENPVADGQQTLFGEALQGALREARNRSTSAVFLLSDGAQRSLSPKPVDPLSIAQAFGEEGIPIYGIAYGASSISGQGLDWTLADLRVDPIVFEKNRVPVTVRVRAIGARGRTTTVRLLLENRSDVPLGKSGPLEPVLATGGVVPQVTITPTEDDQIIPVELSFLPSQAGEFKLAAEVQTSEGELLTRNNRLETIITVKAGGLRVAVIDRLRWEPKFLKMASGASQLQMDFAEIRQSRGQSPVVLDASWFEPDRYNVYILGDVTIDELGESNIKAIAARVQAGAGLMTIGGSRNYSAGRWEESDLTDLVPVMSASANPGGNSKESSSLEGPTPFIPTETGLRRYVLQLDGTGPLIDRWKALAPLEGANRLVPRNPLVEVWAAAPNGEGLLFASEIGKARVLSFAGDSSYLWVLGGAAKAHQQFWRQAILWLARREDDTEAPLWVKVEPRNAPLGAAVGIEYGARAPGGQPRTDVSFDMEIIDPAGTKIPALVSTDAAASSKNTGSGGRLDWTKTEEPGDYWVRVSGKANGENIGLDAVTRFLVSPRDIELDRPGADPDFLKQVAEAGSGQLLSTEKLAGFLDQLIARENPLAKETVQVRLWDHWLMIALFVIAMGIEWVIRKANGWA